MDLKFIIIAGGPIVLILFLLLIVVLIIIVERYLFYKNYKILLKSIQNKIIEKGDSKYNINDLFNEFILEKIYLDKSWIQFLNELEEKKEIYKNHLEFDEFFQRFLNQETLKLEKFLIYLASLGNLSPFIGLLGTVFGIIRSFMHLGETNMVEINRGIAEALIATAVGLIVAIPSSFSFNIFKKTIDNIYLELENIKSLIKSKHFKIHETNKTL